MITEDELAELHRRLDDFEREIDRVRASLAGAAEHTAADGPPAERDVRTTWWNFKRALGNAWQSLGRAMARWAEHVDRDYGDRRPPNRTRAA
jgi:hypothetical protein